MSKPFIIEISVYLLLLILSEYSHYQSIDDRQEYDQSIGRASIEHRQQPKTSYVLKGRSPIEITFIFYNVNIMLHYVMIS